MESDSTPTPGLRDLRTGTGPGYRPASSQWPVMRAAGTVLVTQVCYAVRMAVISYMAG